MTPMSQTQIRITTASNVKPGVTMPTGSGTLTTTTSSTTAVPKTVVSMATAVLSADGTIVVTLPPGADPKNFIINPAQVPKSQPTTGN